jgi:ubiquinone/menaquinone biosynthesis C-methylase UbiE
MLRQAIAKRIGDRTCWIQAEAGQLPLADASFDWVVCANSFHYFRQPEAVLAEVLRVLRPGGSLVLVDWCDDYLSCKLCSWWLRWTDAAFYRTYSVRECEALLEQGGFHIVHRDRFRISWLWGLMRFVCRRPTTLTIPSAS